MNYPDQTVLANLLADHGKYLRDVGDQSATLYLAAQLLGMDAEKLAEVLESYGLGCL